MNEFWRITLWCVILTGCGGPDYPGEQRFPLSGKVSFDGQPVDVGSISFLPLNESHRVSGGYITDGAYSVPEAQGANAGKYRIEIHWQKPTGKMVRQPQTGEMEEQRKEGIPAKYHKDSQLTVEVSKDKTVFDFDLRSK